MDVALLECQLFQDEQSLHVRVVEIFLLSPKFDQGQIFILICLVDKSGVVVVQSSFVVALGDRYG